MKLSFARVSAPQGTPLTSPLTTPPWTFGRNVGPPPPTPPWTLAANVGGGGGTMRVHLGGVPWQGTFRRSHPPRSKGLYYRAVFPTVARARPATARPRALRLATLLRGAGLERCWWCQPGRDIWESGPGCHGDECRVVLWGLQVQESMSVTVLATSCQWCPVQAAHTATQSLPHNLGLGCHVWCANWALWHPDRTWRTGTLRSRLRSVTAAEAGHGDATSSAGHHAGPQ